MALPTVFYVHARFTAMGFPKTHVYRDCRGLKGKTITEFAYVPSGVCAMCLKRWEQEEKARKQAGPQA